MAFFTGFATKHHDGSVTSDEVHDTGDDIQTVFSGQTAEFPVDIDTVELKFTPDGGSEQTVTSSNGTFTHANISSGTVTRAGAINVTFSTPLDDGTDFKTSQYDYFGLLKEILFHIAKSRIETTIGTGDGIATVFGDTLSGTKISKGQLWIRFEIGGALYEAWDNGEGEFEHPFISASSIDYVTKIISVTFTAPIDDTKDVDTLHSDANDGEDWLTLLEPRPVQDFNHVTEPDGDGQLEVVLKNSGVSNKEKIIFGMREYSAVGSGTYGISLSLFDQWDHTDHVLEYYYNTVANPFPAVYSVADNEVSTTIPRFLISDQTMQYWIFSSKSRLMVFVKNVGTIYTSMYAGEGIRVSSQSKYNRPQIVMGNTNLNNRPFTSTSIFSIFNPSTNCGLMFDYSDAYKQLNGSPTTDQYNAGYSSFINTGNLKKTTNGKVITDHVTVVYTAGTFDVDEHDVSFSLEGLFICPSTEVAAEGTLDGGNYIIFQDIFRTEYRSFAAAEIL